jgi:nicotinamide-nucleotide amidase
MPDNNLRQSMVPVGASPIPQQPGTAPGLVCPIPIVGPDGTSSDKVIYAVPGVPYEMKEMITGFVLDDLVARSGERAVIRSRVLRTWGTSESALAEMLADRIVELDALGNPTLAFLASGVEGLKVRITARAADEQAAVAMLDSEQAVLEPLIGHLVFGYDDDNMETVVVRALIERGLTISVAESLTGGYVAGRLCAVPGASATFVGGVIAYDPRIKFDLLGVAPGPVVTEEAAVAMAEGVRRVMGTDIGLATTGVAGPDESEGKPVGTVCLAVAAVDGSLATTVRLPGDRERIRQFSTITLLDLLRRVLD